MLGGADTPTAVLNHFTSTLGGRAELQEFTAGRWIRVAVSGGAGPDTEGTRIHPRPGLALLTYGQTAAATTALLAGFGAQAAAALDRERLRMQASQAEALAEGNRIRTALLAAVSHDLHAARLDQGQRQQPPADRRRVDSRRRSGPARDHRAFQRLDDRHAGVGLGLAVAKGFAEAMGGTIAAVDTPGGGLTIRVTLPVAHSGDRSVLGAGQ